MSKIDFRMGIAAKIAKELDKKDGKEDNKISKDIWNDFVEDKNGKCIRGYITIFNAVKSINYYMKKM